MLGIERMFLNALVEFDGIVQCLTVACSTSILREAVDGETDGVELLLRVERTALVVDAPVDTTILVVDEMLNQIILGPSGSLQILF